MKRNKLCLISILILIITAVTVHATEPTQAELDTFQAAIELYRQSNTPVNITGPDDPPPTPEELKQPAIDALNSFIATYPDSEFNPLAQNYIARCYDEQSDHVNARVEFNKLITDYPTSELVDDAKYQIAFIDFIVENYETALTGFESVILDYEGNADGALSHKAPFAYFMLGECYRKLNDMASARAKWNELIVKFPAHSQAGRAKKRLSQ